MFVRNIRITIKEEYIRKYGFPDSYVFHYDEVNINLKQYGGKDMILIFKESTNENLLLIDASAVLAIDYMYLVCEVKEDN